MIGIIGLGWLGFPLAKQLAKQGYSVKGTTTSEDKLASLNNEIKAVFLLKLEKGTCVGNIDVFFKGLSTLIITIPPKYKTASFDFYLAHIELLLENAKKNGVSKVIFTSSTGVFEDTSTFTNYDEVSVKFAYNKKATVLINAEELVKAYRGFFLTSVVRLGGLVGPGRQPARFLSGKELKNPNAPVNLIHMDDAIEILVKLIQHDKIALQYHAVYPLNETRKAYYSQKTKALSLPEPIYSQNTSDSVGKKILSHFTQLDLGYTYKKRP